MGILVGVRSIFFPLSGRHKNILLGDLDEELSSSRLQEAPCGLKGVAEGIIFGRNYSDGRPVFETWLRSA